MYSALARSVPGLISRAGLRAYATRRILKEAPSNPLITPSRDFQSTGHIQGQVHAEVPAYSTPFNPGPIAPGDFSSAFRTVPPLVSETTTLERALSRSHYAAEEITSAIDFNESATQHTILPVYHRGTKFDREPYWQKIPRWKDVTEKEFLLHSWQIAKNIQGPAKLYSFLNEVLPSTIPTSSGNPPSLTREAFIEDVVAGIKEAPMSIRLTPHILSCIDWSNPLDDPLRRQFIPMKSTTSVCGLYCRYCTRSYAVGGNTETVTKSPNKPIKARWDDALDYIRVNPTISDVVVSGGDSYYLLPDQLRYIGSALLSIPSIRRFRIATKGLCVSPSRTLDTTDAWTAELIRLSQLGREQGVQVALHTHFNHPNEIRWVTREAAQRLFEQGVVVRNQSVLLRGVNDSVETMGRLVRELANMNVQPYYIYQCDMVAGIEDLRTPLSTILHLEQQIRGSIAGFMMPSFVVDLPGGGGKRLAAGFESYVRKTGRSTFVAPAVKGEVGDQEKKGKVYEYWDPVAFTGDSGFAARGGEATRDEGTVGRSERSVDGL